MELESLGAPLCFGVGEALAERPTRRPARRGRRKGHRRTQSAATQPRPLTPLVIWKVAGLQVAFWLHRSTLDEPAGAGELR